MTETRWALATGAVIWVALDLSRGREQAGRRPAVVVSTSDHLDIVTALVIVLPCTSVDRGWPNHVRLTGATGLSVDTFAMTEQPRTIDRSRILEISGTVDAGCLDQLGDWLHDWLSCS